jgi:hypothetical protein
MRLVVDQAYIHDVLTAVSNSRLRIQITQVTLNHERNIARATPGAGTGMYPGGGERGMMGGRPLMNTPPQPGRLTMGMMGGRATSGAGERGAPTSAEATSGFVDNARLFELSIYGIASLYERPGKPAADGSAPTEGTPPATPAKP